jgi:C4-type Zn-finger protein
MRVNINQARAHYLPVDVDHFGRFRGGHIRCDRCDFAFADRHVRLAPKRPPGINYFAAL